MVKNLSSGMKVPKIRCHMKTYQVVTEQDILTRIKGLDPEILFWMRYDVARAHISKSRGESRVRELLDNKLFWNWWLRIWEINDKKILCNMTHRRMDHAPSGWYQKQQLTMCTKMHWQIPQNVLKSITTINS